MNLRSASSLPRDSSPAQLWLDRGEPSAGVQRLCPLQPSPLEEGSRREERDQDSS